MLQNYMTTVHSRRQWHTIKSIAERMQSFNVLNTSPLKTVAIFGSGKDSTLNNTTFAISLASIVTSPTQVGDLIRK